MKYKRGNRWKSPKGKFKYQAWRKSVMELNFRKVGLSRYYVCLKCKKKRKTTRVMHAHHEYSWHEYPDKRYDKSNGVVLCIRCHNKFHRKYGYKAVKDPKYLKEYLRRDGRI